MNNTFIKICSVKEKNIAKFVSKNKVNFIGFNFYPSSPRYISPDKAKKIIKSIKKYDIKKVGVFVNQDMAEVVEIYNQLKLDYIQLHGNESKDYIKQFKDCNLIKAIQIKDSTTKKDLKKYSLPQVKYLLIDTFKKDQFGGTGETFNWKKHEYLKNMDNIIIAGGLNEDNVVSAKNYFNPAGLDINSGVEKAPGVKSKHKIKRILKLLRRE